MLEHALLLAGAIFLLNSIPAFAPPTWMLLSLVGLNHPLLNPFAVAVLAAVAATAGRMLLAHMSKRLVRDHLMGAVTRANIDACKQALEQQRGASIGGILLFTFSPVPSNYLFMAYGLTGLPLPRVALPFFLGRCVSYSAWVYASQTAALSLDIAHLASGAYLGTYFVLSQVVLLGLMWLLARLDWRHFIELRKLRLLRLQGLPQA